MGGAPGRRCCEGVTVKLPNLQTLSKGKKNLFKNTAMLYLLQFSSYFFSLITVPYQTRVLGPVFYGKLGFATAVMVYFKLFLDFGFILSSTARVSAHRDDKPYIARLLSSVTIIKLVFSVVCGVVLYALCLLVPSFAEESGLLALYLLSTIVAALMPDFLYRGLEQMTTITVRTVGIKAFFTVMVFLFLKQQSDYWMVPLFLLAGELVALVAVYIHLFKSMKIRFGRVGLRDILDDLRDSSTFFLSRIASSIYSSSNTLILGLVDPGGLTVGYYTAVDKLTSTAKSAFSPLSDSLYPYMIKHRDFKLVKKTLLLAMPVITAGCAVVFIFAEPVCVLLFGQEFASCAPILRAIMPVILVTLPSYILGFPTLSAMGLARIANTSVIISTVFHVAGLVVLFIAGAISPVSLSLLTSGTTCMTMGLRAFAVWKNRALLGRAADE